MLVKNCILESVKDCNSFTEREEYNLTYFRYLLVVNELGAIEFHDIDWEEGESYNSDGTCSTFRIKDGVLYEEYSYIDIEESTRNDVVFGSDSAKRGKIIYGTNDFEKIKNLIGLEIKKEGFWDRWYKNQMGGKKMKLLHKMGYSLDD